MHFVKELSQNPIYRFLLVFFGVFGSFYYFNQFYIGITVPGGFLYIPFLDKYLNYISCLRYVLLQTAEAILNLLGYTTFTTNYWLRVSGHGGIVVVYSCLGYGVMSFFAAFVLAWPKPLKEKLWFLPLGLLLIQALNVTRFILLSLYWRKSGLKGLVDHHDIFNAVLYIILLAVIYFWVNSKQALGTRGRK